MKRTGDFRGPADRASYLEAYATAMRHGPTPDKELDVDTAFGSTRVYRYGAADARPIVMLAGMAGSAASLAPYVEGFARRHPVYTVDTIGEAGLSVQTAPLRDHADRARWLDEVMAKLDLTDVHLVGWSTGGFYAVHQAITAPARLRSVTLIEPTTVTVGFAPKIMLIALAAAIVNRDSMWRRFMRWSAGEDADDRPEVQVTLAAIRHFRAAIPPQVRPPARAIATITVPLLALFGAHSTAQNAPRAAARLRALVPRAEVELWPELTHAVSERDLARITELVLARS
ncbi:alpha/beta fold hydrolase [Actinophytocola sediminis]